MGEFVNFIKTVTSRRIADWARKNKHQIKTDSLDVDDEDSRGPEPAGNLGDPESSAILRDAMKRVLDRRSEEHQRVILMRIAGKPSRMVVEAIEGQTVANVDQLYFRFRKDLKAELGE
jgi:DNA-directed RNA polymerase specialized sigma24 family protein